MISGNEIFNIQPLFRDVQLSAIFPDGKTFVDCTPSCPLDQIAADYEKQKDGDDFDLKNFILQHFTLPVIPQSGYVTDPGQTITEHISELWKKLTRQPDESHGSLIPLPYPYVVPGGRFGEIYYWDSYFTMLGLEASGEIELVAHMVNNFAYLIDTIGYIPNGNRSYYIGRSQPPFFSRMVSLLGDIKGPEAMNNYLPQLEKEYAFWMNGVDELSDDCHCIHHVVRMPDGNVMNRYWDEHDTPRPEAYKEDIELAVHSDQDPRQLFRHLRAGAASGWDYSHRWFRDSDDFSSIQTSQIVPVDLNSLLYHLESLIAKIYTQRNLSAQASNWKNLADRRKQSIQQYCWNEKQSCYVDYDISLNSPAEVLTLAACYPLYFGIADEKEAAMMATVVKRDFLRDGGLVTTLEHTGQQWDAPNGWAPLQWIAITGLANYGHEQLAEEIAQRWIRLNKAVYQRTGKLMEKYNVIDTHLEAGGGEYPGQDGFGWTNGVLLALMKKYPAFAK